MAIITAVGMGLDIAEAGAKLERHGFTTYK
jgi:hypothetical protein